MWESATSSETSSETSPENLIALLPSPAERQIILQVGERRFTTTKETLINESGFFSSLLSERWDNSQADGSYFIDADATVFEHVLRYLRHQVLPIFYDNAKGHDHALYLLLLEQATYFQIDRLETWLKSQSYLQAVKVTTTAERLEGKYEINETTGTDISLEYHPAWETVRVYICPRGIAVHRGNPSACGRQCRLAQGDGDPEFIEERVLKTLVIRRKTVFDQQLCLDGR